MTGANDWGNTEITNFGKMQIFFFFLWEIEILSTNPKSKKYM